MRCSEMLVDWILDALGVKVLGWAVEADEASNCEWDPKELGP